MTHTADPDNPTERGDNHQHTKEYEYAYSEMVDPNPIIGWTCWCGASESYDDAQINQAQRASAGAR